MGLWDKLKGELVDIIYWKDDSNGEVVSHRFERYNDEIKNGAKLTVDQSQIAVVVNEGVVADIFYQVPTGVITLETANVPILATLKGWKHGFNSPYKAMVYFLTAGDINEIKWGTPNPVPVSKKGFGQGKFVANGSFTVQIDTEAGTDPNNSYPGVRRFMQHLVKTDGEFTKTELKSVLRQRIGNFMYKALKQSLEETSFGPNSNVEDFHVDPGEIAMHLEKNLAETFKEWGLILRYVNVDTCEPDEATQKLIEKYSNSRMATNMANEAGIQNEMLRFQMSNKTIEDVNAGNNQNAGGGNMMNNMMEAGIGMGMMGMMMNQMGNMNQVNQGQGNNNTPPPPPPGLSFHVAKNGQQSGPFSVPQLQQYVQSGEFTPDTLVWRQGMAGWVAANTVPELANLFGAVPPPPPPVG